MPWSTPMSQRSELVRLARQPGANISQLARRFDVTRATAYKWIDRYEAGGDDALHDRSRRPHTSPTRTPPDIERAVLGLRDQHPAWGGRKLHAVLARTLGERAPAPSTITGILRRRGRLPAEPPKRDYVRFEADAPNDLWQMDFKGDFVTGDGSRCYPLTLTDDHSRFALCVAACADQRYETVMGHLLALFERYGLPRGILSDNGSPWGAVWATDGAGRWRWRCTRLGARLIARGITVSHGRPRHPQTQGKEERFHRTLREEVLDEADGGAAFADLAACQAAFDPWRDVYNGVRPHDALGLAVPVDRYRVSPREAPRVEPVVSYDTGVVVRKVDGCGKISFRGRVFRVGKGLRGLRVGLTPRETDGVWSVWYGHQEVWAVSLRDPP